MRYYVEAKYQELPVGEDDKCVAFELLSVGISCDDGREYYAVNMDADWIEANADPRLRDTVIPQLGAHSNYRRAHQIGREVLQFLKPTHDADPTELWGWYGAHTYVTLTSFLKGTTQDLPDYIPGWINDVRQIALRHHNPVLPPQVNGEHNALADARHAMFLHKFLEALAK